MTESKAPRWGRRIGILILLALVAIQFIPVGEGTTNPPEARGERAAPGEGSGCGTGSATWWQISDGLEPPLSRRRASRPPLPPAW